jgi:hypothetical protein
MLVASVETNSNIQFMFKGQMQTCMLGGGGRQFVLFNCMLGIIMTSLHFVLTLKVYTMSHMCVQCSVKWRKSISFYTHEHTESLHKIVSELQT